MRKLTLLLTSLFLIGVGMVNAQTKRVTGNVTSAEDNQPIPGVQIQVKSTSLGAISDVDGNYAIQVPDDATALVFSFIGMETTEIEIGSKSVIDLKMETSVIMADEVIVSAYGITKARKAAGYATTSLGGDEIAQAKTVNPMTALQGKVSGIDITSAPGPGATQNVIIRGASSFGNNQPLYIVDGVPIVNSQNRSGEDPQTNTSGNDLNAQVDFGSGINALNPDDIEDMTILKGAAATALYGSRAANGVILITTKSGKNTNGKIQVSYDGSVSVNRVGRIPDRQSIFGQGWSGDHELLENGNWGPKYDGKDRVWGTIVDNSQKLKPFSFLEDRVRDFYDLGVNYQNSVSASGGTEKTNYYVSFSNNSVNGVLPEDVDTYKRNTISTRGSHTYGKLTLSSSINFANEKTKAVPSGQGTTVFRSLWEIPEDISIVDMKDYNNKFNNLENYFTPYGINPYFSLNENGASQIKNKFFGKAQADFAILDNLKLTYRFGGDIETSTSESWQAKIEIPNPNSANYGSSVETPGSYDITKRTRYETNQDILLTHQARLSDNIGLNSLIGTNINQRGYDYVMGENLALDVPGFNNLINGLNNPIAEQYYSERRLIGVFANFDFDFKNYLFVTLTARNDWSSTLPEDNNSYFYPGITGSFVFTDWIDEMGGNAGPISFGKARMAYGYTGNDADPYKIHPVYRVGLSNNPGYPDIDDLEFPLNGINSWMVANTLGSLDLAPEITSEFETGLEMTFFQNRVGFDFSYYNRFTKGMIETLPMDPSSGYSQQTVNLGDVRNKGIEVVVFGSPIKTRNFEWNMSVNYSQNKNQIEKLNGGEVSLAGFGGATIVAVEGKEMGLFKTYVPQTVEMDGTEHTIVDGNGMPVATPDVQVIDDRSIQEKFRAGFTNTFTYKNVSLGATFDLRYGGYMYSYQKDYMHWTGSAIESTANDRRTFIVPNSVVDNGDGTYSENTTPVASSDWHTFYSNGGFQRDNYAIIDKSFLKLRELRLSYALPANLVNKLNLTSIRLSAVASNILLWTPTENAYIDPETTSFGNDINAKFGEFGANPTNQTYTFGLAVTF